MLSDIFNSIVEYCKDQGLTQDFNSYRPAILYKKAAFNGADYSSGKFMALMARDDHIVVTEYYGVRWKTECITSIDYDDPWILSKINEIVVRINAIDTL